MRTHLVSSLSFHTLIALSASVAWQSLLLTLTSIDGHLHSPLIGRVDVRLSPFCLLHTTSSIIFYSSYSDISMDHTHVFQGWASSNALGLHEQASWMHTHLVFSLSFHTLIALVHPLHGNPYSSHRHQLMGISIAC